MCMNQRRFCECGKNSAFLSFRDNLLPPEILLHLYCPRCAPPAAWDEAARLAPGPGHLRPSSFPQP
jgi:hypothetical protein